MDAITLSEVLWTVCTIVGVLLLWSLVGYPHWRVWASHQEGLADLQRARNEQQIQIAQAQSRLDAAELNKKAAVIEAQAVALQITEIGAQLLMAHMNQTVAEFQRIAMDAINTAPPGTVLPRS